MSFICKGTGEPGDIDRPLRFESMADDVSALMNFLKIEKADVLGYSLGGGSPCRQRFGIRRSSTVSSSSRQRCGGMVPFRGECGVPSDDGASPEDRAKHPGFAAWSALSGSQLGRRFSARSQRWSLAHFDWSEQVKKLRSPTMLVFADSDSIRLEHIVAFYEALGGGQRDAGLDGSLRSPARLGIVPGATHYNILSTTAVAMMTSRFLS